MMFWIAILLFAGAEWGSRYFLTNLAGDSTFGRYASLAQRHARADASGTKTERYIPHRYIGYVPQPGYADGANHHNRHGFRGDEIAMPKPEGEYRIAVLGGSIVYTPGVDEPAQSVPGQLQRLLRERSDRVTVINAGAEGHVSHASLMNLQFRVMDLDPDLIIYCAGTEDILARMVWPPSAYTSDNTGMEQPIATGLYMPPLLEYSTLLRMIGIAAGISQPHAATDNTIAPHSPAYYGDAWLEGNLPSEITTAGMLDANQPIHFRRNLESMAMTARASGVDIAFATIPACEACGGPWTEPRITEAVAEMNNTIREVAEQTGSPIIDLEADVPGDTNHFVETGRPAAQGAETMARAIADSVVVN